jgi:hypothetical protein
MYIVEVDMHFSVNLFVCYLLSYVRLLKSMLQTSWMADCVAGLQADYVSDTSIKILDTVRDWYNWKLTSLLDVILWIGVFAMLLFVVPLCGLVALIKCGMWLVGLLPAVIVCGLAAIRFEERVAK